MGHCDCKNKKHCKKCVDKRIIKCLPVTIDKSGHYCLGKDFVWSNTGSAITVNADNVVLDFNQRRIRVDSPTDSPLLLVENSKDVVLSNVHLEGIMAGKFAAPGIKVVSSKLVNVNSPVFHNLGKGGFDESSLYAEGVNGLNVSNLYLKNDGEEIPSIAFHAIGVNNSSNVTILDSQITNGVTLLQNVVNLDILKCQVDNSSVPVEFIQRGFVIASDTTLPGQATSNVRVTDCNVSVRDWYGVFVASFPFDTTEPLSNVLIENNIFNNIDGGAELFGGKGIYLQGVKDCDVRNNVVSTSNSGQFDTGSGIELFGSQNSSVVNNTVFVNKGSFYGIALFGDDFEPIFTTTGNTVSNNRVTRDDSVSQGITSGIFIDSFPEIEYAKLNTVSNNVVSGFDVGIADRDSNFSATATASCNVFSNNVENGNVENFLVDTSAPANNVVYENKPGCELLGGAMKLNSVRSEENKRRSPVTLDDRTK